MTMTRPRFTPRPCLAALFLLLPFLGPGSARAQSTQADILAQLKGKPLFLRGLWRADDLSFTHDGKPVQPYAPDSFTLAGIDVDDVRFTADTLEIRGHRVGLEFVPKEGARRVRLKWRHYSGNITLHIAGHSGEDFGPALAAVFAPDLATLVPSPRQYWARIGNLYTRDANSDQATEDAADDAAEAAIGPDASTDSTAAPVPDLRQTGEPQPSRPTHVGGSVKPPVLLSSVDPSFSDAARGMHFSGTVEVYLWLDASGSPTHLTVVRAAGLGLDERALAAVATYRFAPAMQNGKPVVVDLYIAVNFKIF